MLNYTPSETQIQDYTNYLSIAIPELYVCHNTSIPELSESFNLSHDQVREILDTALLNFDHGKKKNGRLNFKCRRIIQYFNYRGQNQAEIAEIIGCNISTISRELKRCAHLDSYSAVVAQKDYKDKNKAQRPERCKINNSKTREYVDWSVKNLTSYKISFCDSYARFEKGEGPDGIACEDAVSPATMYRYFRQGKLPLKEDDFPYSKKMRAKLECGTFGRKSSRCPGKSIETRPELKIDSSGLIEFGHWELDLVEGVKGSAVLLTLIEKRTRMSIIRVLPSKAADGVQRCLSEIFESCGDLTSSIFKTITTDNGTEFSRLPELETYGPVFYYCHVRAPKEKAQNERNNRLIRKYFPNGEMIPIWDPDYIRAAQDELNQIRRSVLGWNSAQECFNLELTKLTLQSKRIA